MLLKILGADLGRDELQFYSSIAVIRVNLDDSSFNWKRHLPLIMLMLFGVSALLFYSTCNGDLKDSRRLI